MLYVYQRPISLFSNLSDDDNFNLPGYKVVRADYRSNTDSLANSLPLKVLDIQFLQEYSHFISNCNFISLYRSLSQSKDEFESFISTLSLSETCT